MRVLLTGALGYIGCETLIRLSQRPDITVYAVDRDTEAFNLRSCYFMRFPNIKFIKTDIAQPYDYPEVDIVIHLAATVGYLDSGKDPEMTLRNNIESTQQMAGLNKPIIFFSTGSVYGEIGKVCDETVAVNPKSTYAQSKYQSELVVEQANDYIIFRPATAMGLGLKVRNELLVHDMARKAVKDQHIELYQPLALRSFYSVYKLAELIEFACDNFHQLNRNVYNVGCNRGNVTKQDLINQLGKYCNFTYSIVDGSDADTRDYNIDYKKLATVWPNHDEDFTKYLPSIIEYQTKC